MIKLEVKKLTETAILPEKNHKDDAGIDFFTDEDVTIFSGTVKKVSTGLAIQMSWDLPTGYIYEDEDLNTLYYNSETHNYNHYFKRNFILEMEMRSRSGMLTKQGIEVEGTVDVGYTGEISLMLINNSSRAVKILKGTKVAQGVISILPRVNKIIEIETLENTERGEKGFGSSGV